MRLLGQALGSALHGGAFLNGGIEGVGMGGRG
jgi:hypothetical protein